MSWASAPEPSPPSAPRPWGVVVAVSLPLAVLSIDFTGVAVALPSMGDELGVSSGSLSWVINAFALGSAATLVVAGRLADLVGRRRILLAGLVLFTGATLVSGLAPTFGVLVVGRALQGVGAALFMAPSLAIVSNAFPADDRATGIGVWSAVGGVAMAVSPLVGGLVTELLSWRWFFFINLPLLLESMVLTLMLVPAQRRAGAPGLDLAGAATATAAIFGIVLGLQLSVDRGWTDPVVLVSLAVGLGALVGFFVVERRVEEPLVSRDLLGSRAFGLALAVAFLANWGFGAVNYLMTLFLQDVLFESALATGVVFLAYSLPFAVMGALVGRVVARRGTRAPMVVGMVVIAASFLAFAGIGVAAGLALVVFGLALSGVGQGLAYNASTTSVMDASPEEEAGVASGVLTSLRNVGLVLGVTVSSLLIRTVAQNRLESEGAAAGLDAGQIATVRSLVQGSDDAREDLASLPSGLASTVEEVARRVFTDGMRAAVLLIAVVSLVGAVVATRAGRGPDTGAGDRSSEGWPGGRRPPSEPPSTSS